jgi:hypothetical protein
MAAALLVGAAMVPALEAAPASAAASLCVSDPTPPVGWTFVATYTDCATCEAAGPFNPLGAANWQCVPSAQPGQFDLYVL